MNGNHLRFCVVVLAACASLSPATARAQWYYGGIDLEWQACGTAGTKSLTSDCTTTGDLTLHGTFVAPPGLDAVVGYRITVGPQSAGNIPWWDYGAGGCREGLWSLTADTPGNQCRAVAQAVLLSPTFSRFPNGGVAFGATASFLQPIAVPEGGEFYGFTLTLRRPSPSVCDGCCVPTCLLASLEFFQESGIIRMDADFDGAASWQGGWCTTRQATASTSAGCLPTPTRPTTWGALKTIYR